MKSDWHLESLEHVDWGIGDAWFDAPHELPDLAKASHTSAEALLDALDEFVMFSESVVRHVGDVRGVRVEVTKRGLRVHGTWRPTTLRLEENRSCSPAEEKQVVVSPFDSLGIEPTTPVVGSLRGPSGAALLTRDAEGIWALTWDDDELVLHRVDGDLTWTHGEGTPGAVWWRARFRTASGPGFPV